MSPMVTIRVALPDDAANILAIYGPYITDTAITFEYEVPTVAEFQARIRHVQEKYPYLVAEANGEIVGYAYAAAFNERAAYDWAVETSLYVSREKQCMGIGSKLYAVLEDCLRAQGILNLNACIAYPEREDEHLKADSVKFHEKLGYRMVGQFHNCGYKFNRWYHMVWMEKEIGAHLEHQPPIKPFHEAVWEGSSPLLPKL